MKASYAEGLDIEGAKERELFQLEVWMLAKKYHGVKIATLVKMRIRRSLKGGVKLNTIF